MRGSTRIVMDRITAALLEIMKQVPIDEISICEIVEKAEVSRNSFYRHFQDKDDILRCYISSETEQWLRDTGKNILNIESPQAYIVFLLDHLYQYREVIDIMIRDGKMYLLEEEFDRRFNSVLTGTSDPYQIAFIIGGFYKLFCYWAKTGYEKTPQEIAEYVK